MPVAEGAGRCLRLSGFICLRDPDVKVSAFPSDCSAFGLLEISEIKRVEDQLDSNVACLILLSMF